MKDTDMLAIDKFMRCGTLIIGVGALLLITSACSFLGSRPQNLRGQVRCQAVPGNPAQPLVVQVVLDQAAVQQHSKLEVIREVLVPSRSGEEVYRLQVDVGAANGAIDGCGSFTDSTFRIDITGQMLSYPSWIRISTRAADSVTLTIQDTFGNDLATPILLEPQPDRFRIQWLR